MSLLTFHRSSLEREEKWGGAEQRKVTAIAIKINRKQDELNRAKTITQQKRISRQIQSLRHDRATAEKAIAVHQQRVAVLKAKIVDEEAAERKNLSKRQERVDRDRYRSQAVIERRVASTSVGAGRLSVRLAAIEDVMKETLRDCRRLLDHGNRALDLLALHHHHRLIRPASEGAVVGSVKPRVHVR